MAQCVIPVRADANLERLNDAREAADTPEAQIERYEATQRILKAVQRGASREELANLLRAALRGERVAGYIDGDADARRDQSQQRLQDAAEAIDRALTGMAVRKSVERRDAERRARKARAARTRVGAAA